jgi:hypothetical protein
MDGALIGAIILFVIVFLFGLMLGMAIEIAIQEARAEPAIQCYAVIQLNKLAYHWHELIIVQQNGKQLTVPAQIGFLNGKICNIHTHLTDGIIHIETFKGVPQFTLGQFLDMWNKTQPASYKQIFKNEIKSVFQNDKIIQNFRNITLANGQSLTILLK